LSLDFIT